MPLETCYEMTPLQMTLNWAWTSYLTDTFFASSSLLSCHCCYLDNRIEEETSVNSGVMFPSEPIRAVANKKLFLPQSNLNADCIQSHCRQKPDVSGFFWPVKKGALEWPNTHLFVFQTEIQTLTGVLSTVSGFAELWTETGQQPPG